MRILVANDGVSDVGGVQAYLDAVIPTLEARGHSVAIAYCTDSGTADARIPLGRLQRFLIAGSRPADVLDAIRRWRPDICYSHNMRDLGVDGALETIAPVIKFMHGYFGTCIGGHKMHGFPKPVACDRVFGPACAALYLPRRCGRLNVATLVGDWRWARLQQSLFPSYAGIVVASEHMRREYARNGCDGSRIHVNPLFPTNPPDPAPSMSPRTPHVAFMGRMTKLKGGDLLIAAVQHASRRMGAAIGLTMIGDGPERRAWEKHAAEADLPCTFTGWLGDGRRWDLLRGASVVALPSLWPEPFGLVGLEAGALGVPAIAVAAGGVSEWLRPGQNGVAVPPPATPRSFGDALASLLTDAGALSTLRAGAHRVAQEMTVTAHVDRLEKILHGANPKALAS
jgi:glycosyltransferase involved in cell wall biosynthesis